MKKIALFFGLLLAFSIPSFAAVDINKANKEELKSVKGIGDKKAEAIIEYRKKNGPFKSAEDIEKVNGIGPGIMKKIASEITIDGQPVKPASGKPAADSAKAMKPSKAEKPAKDSKPADTKSESKTEKK